MRMVNTCQRNHGETMGKGSQVLLELVWGTAGWNEMNFVEIEPAIRGASDGHVAVVNRVERTAEKRDAARLVFYRGALQLRSGQCASENPV